MKKSIKWNAILLALVYIAAGVLLVFFTEIVQNRICEAIGIIAIALGVFRIVYYLFMDVRQALFRNDLVEGIVLVLVGALILYQKASFQPLIPFLFAIFLMISGFSKVQDEVDSKRLGYPNHSLFLVLSLISIVAALAVLFNVVKSSSMLYLVVGIALMYSGITDFFSAIFLSRLFHKYLDSAHNPPHQEVIPEPAEPEASEPEEKMEEPVSSLIVPESVLPAQEPIVLHLDGEETPGEPAEEQETE